MDARIQGPAAVRGLAAMPPDKAIAHRLVLLGALGEGEVVISPWPRADDCQRTLDVAQALGASASLSGTRLTLRGVGSLGLRPPGRPLECGESGTTLRLAAGVLAGQLFEATLAAAPSLSRRPMQRIVEPLRQMGAQVDGVARGGDVYPPLTIRGRRPLRAIRYAPPVASAQVKSAVLLAGLFADGPTTVIEASATRDHTERALALFGAAVTRQGVEVTVRPSPLRSPPEAVIPGDLSSGAFFVVAAAAGQGSELTVGGVGLNPTRAGFLAVLRAMGADIAEQGQGPPGEQLGNLLVRSAPLRGVTVAAPQVPGLIDELPALMVAATQAQGRTRFEGVGELRVKETDRIASMVDGLRRLGARIQAEGPETIVVDGPCRLTGAAVEAAGDHRTAMSLAVAGLLAHGETRIRGAECVAKSFPDFFDRLAATTGSPTVITVDKP
jgi:3-phosphoshikimate 1-carboxyvinyltransferase